MNKEAFIKILKKYLKGTATQAEKSFLLNYYERFDAEPDEKKLQDKEYKTALKDQMKAEIWDRINQEDKRFQKIKPLQKKSVRLSVAAALLLFCVTGITYIFQGQILKKNTTTQSALMPKQRLLYLSDGSLVTLDVNSKFNYPVSFEGLDKREVYLEGEAYFDIKHDPLKPFIIHTNNLKTTVLGTAFNIKAWPADDNISIKVTRGKVKVADQHKTIEILTKDEQLIYKKKADIVRQKIDKNIYLAWREQDLRLENVTVKEAVDILEKRYKVSIICKEKLLLSKRFTTTLVKGESLDQVLESICEFNDAVYHYNKEKASVIISSK